MTTDFTDIPGPCTICGREPVPGCPPAASSDGQTHKPGGVIETPEGAGRNPCPMLIQATPGERELDFIFKSIVYPAYWPIQEI